MQKHKKLSARILSLALSVLMVATMLPMTAFAADPIITIQVNNATTASGATLKAAITASSVVNVTLLKITAGKVTADDWKYLKNLSNMTSFEIYYLVADVADIPDGTASLPIFPESIETVTVPQAITIGKNAFNACTALTSVDFPRATSIGDAAFSFCAALTSVSFPEATHIEVSAFGACSKLTSASFPSATSIGAGAFYYCTTLESLKLGEAAPITVGADAFIGCPATRALGYVRANGAALSGIALAKARAAYKAAADSDTTDNLWYGWTIAAQGPAAITVGGTGATSGYEDLTTGLQKAFDDIAENGTVKIGGSVTLHATLGISGDKKSTLDLNGNTITFAGDLITLTSASDSPSFTITDTSVGKLGGLSSTNKGAATIRNDSSTTVVIDGGTVSATGADSAAILNNKLGDITIQSGTVSATGAEGFAIMNNSSGKIDIAGGKVIASGSETTAIKSGDNSAGTITIHETAVVTSNNTASGSIHVMSVSTGTDKVKVKVQGDAKVTNTATPTAGKAIFFDPASSVTAETVGDYLTMEKRENVGKVFPSAFVPVTGITAVPSTATVGRALTLTGTVAPAYATNETIVWSVKDAGTTGASITDSTLNTTAAGTVIVTATITNGLTASSDYTQDFNITVKRSGGGGDDDDSSSGGGSSSTTTPPSTKPTEPVTGSSNTNATVDDKGNANVNVTDKNITDAVKAAKDAAAKKGVNAGEVTALINVTAPANSNPNTMTVNLPKSVQQQVISNKIGNMAIVIDKPDISIGMNLATITEMNKQANADIALSATRTDATKLSAEAKDAIGSRPAFDLKASYANGTKSITNFGTGSVSVAIPYTLQTGEVASGVYAVYVDESGKVHDITDSSYDATARALRFSTNHFSVYGIGYKTPVGFIDIADHWAKTDIEFVFNRGLMNGTSNTTFAPDSAMTRGMFVTTLGRLSGTDVSSYKTGKFSDVNPDLYYAPYVNWAAEKGIVKGMTASIFAPDQSITRQEMAVIMSNYAKTMGYTIPETNTAVAFADDSSIGSWAADAVKQMQMAAILNGKDGNKFDPTGTATRGEISAMLHRYVSLVIDK